MEQTALRKATMRRVTARRAVLAGLLIALALFCVYGFMASFESGPAGRLVFKIGYAVVGLGCLAGSAWALMKE